MKATQPTIPALPQFSQVLLGNHGEGALSTLRKGTNESREPAPKCQSDGRLEMNANLELRAKIFRSLKRQNV